MASKRSPHNPDRPSGGGDGASFGSESPNSDSEPLPDSELHNDPPRIAHQNGRWLDARDLSLPLDDAAVTQAVTAVERVRIYNGSPFRLNSHLDRWEHTLNSIQLVGLPSRSQLIDLIVELLSRNHRWIRSQTHCGILLLGSPGAKGTPTLIADLYPIDPAQLTRRLNEGSAVIVTSVQQQPPSTWPRDIKVRCRLHYYLADRQAESISPDGVGMLIDSDGSVTESGIANLLAVRKGTIFSPRSEQILPGVSLNVVRELAGKLGIPWREDILFAKDLRESDEVMLTGTSSGIWFARSVDGHTLPTERDVYRRIRAAFDEFVKSENV